MALMDELLRNQPEALERLVRDGLLRTPDEAPSRENMELMLILAIMEQHRFTEARSLLDSILKRFPSSQRALYFDAELAFYMDEPWPTPWIKFEARWPLEFTGPIPNLPRERWDGRRLMGERIVLAAEGGLGDQIQFARFARELKTAGAGSVLISAHSSLVPLLGTMDAVDCCQPKFEASQYDVWVPMLSVPGILRITPATLPKKVPYLFPKAAPQTFERGNESEKMNGPSPRRKVGICWHSGNDTKNMSLELFRQILNTAGIQVFALGEKEIWMKRCSVSRLLIWDRRKLCKLRFRYKPWTLSLQLIPWWRIWLALLASLSS